MNLAVPPAFDIWTSLLLAVCIFGFFLSCILFSKKEKSNNTAIILIIFGFTCILLEYVFFWTGHRAKHPYLYFFSHCWYLAFGPLLYSYITRFYKLSFKVSWLHFLPALLTFVLIAYYFSRSGGFSKLTEFENEALYHFFWNLRSPWLPVLSFALYILVILDFIKFFRGEGQSQYSTLRKRWTKIILGLFALFALAYTSYYVLVIFSFFNPAWDYAISFSMAFGIYSMGYIVFKEPSIFNGELLSKLFIKGTNGNGSQLPERTKTELYSKLLTHIETKKPYFDNELRLVSLADELGFSTHLLSQIINDKANMNFNSFINEYRLREAESLLLTSDTLSIRNISFEVGFNSKATFYAAFKKKHNCTPSEYRNKLLKS